MRARLTLVAVALAAVSTLVATGPAQATMPHVQAPATTPHAAAFEAAVAARSPMCGRITSGSNGNGEWGRAQICAVDTATQGLIYRVATRDSRTDGYCAETLRKHPLYSTVFQQMSPRTRSCTTMGWITRYGPKPSPYAGARLEGLGGRDWITVDMPDVTIYP
jgi:hypothetical protein